MNSTIAQPCKEAMVARVGLSHTLDNFEDLRRPASPLGIRRLCGWVAAPIASFSFWKCYFIVLGTLARRGGRGASKMGLAGRPRGPWAGRPRGPERPLGLNFLAKSSRCFWSIFVGACGPLDDVYFGIFFETNPGVVTLPNSSSIHLVP